MSIQAGLVGLPNVGKSTLFNALTKSSVPAENYPFCTIDPHVAITHVPDERMDILQTIYHSQKQIPTTVSFVDIAGLVKGASAGQGLGNQFLSHIREVDLILHVLRCFDDTRIIRDTNLNPIEDFEIILSELMLKDLESVQKRLERVERDIKLKKNSPLELQIIVAEKEILLNLQDALNNADHIRAQQLIAGKEATTVPLLSTKKFLIIANISEADLENNQYEQNPYYQAVVHTFGPEKVIPICAKIVGELSQLSVEEADEMMDLLGIRSHNLDRIIRKTHEYLGLITFFTCGPKEIHAWSIPKGTTIRQAAGEIHSDLEKGFICAEVYNSHDALEYKSEAKLKERGKIRTEGQDYIVQDGDIIHIRFNV